MDVEPFVRAMSCGIKRGRSWDSPPNTLWSAKLQELFPLKGHEYVLAAAKRVIHKHPEARFLWVGDGILRESFEQQIRRSDLQKYFILTGLQRPERIPSLLGAMDILVHASLREGLARALPRALIAGKPVVSYDIDGD
jgi:glycosyltransferase involved in cell wall biosynthesis